MSILLEKVTYVYQSGTPWQKTALCDVSLAIKKGDCVGIMGRAGAGKSTLLAVLNGLLKPQKGRVIVDGIDVTSLPAHKMAFLRQKVGLVFQFPEEQFFAPTVYEEISFALHNAGFTRGEVERRVKDAMDKVGLDYASFKERSLYTLSSGEKRRVGLATVLALKPQYLLLDEPTAALDYEGREKIYAIIREANKRGTTVIIVAHNLEHLANVCNRIIILEEGRVALDLQLEELALYAEEMERLGIYPPFHHQVVHKLQKKGLDINIYIKTREEAACAVKKLFPSLQEGE
ncbi:energy-coupling factor transport system ATP-binding protein [Thermosyntropha lipolytica DSM 11003]|uniref:Energy-coupling factor transport system ATP-binding protein n=1 Tax=Thermosyntropha lipolytica DSM 11003 TaxID=1123382 RepID=A0A1M5MDA2_9FIRM|nr:ATP-binding cassette domain-containing protein [Thermosyntropha lipolytica]SHG75235.1 energy-coupling factor transport system ATP-binding protein [Thermosyntropha lipolytica DSM 11003]